MAKTIFDTNPVLLQSLLTSCEAGKVQLPDFQRSWVWEEERIMSLIASVSRGFPMGALIRGSCSRIAPSRGLRHPRCRRVRSSSCLTVSSA